MHLARWDVARVAIKASLRDSVMACLFINKNMENHVLAEQMADVCFSFFVSLAPRTPKTSAYRSDCDEFSWHQKRSACYTRVCALYTTSVRNGGALFPAGQSLSRLVDSRYPVAQRADRGRPVH